MFMDYKNLLGYGRGTLFISAPKKHYYLKVADSLEQWLEEHIFYLEN